MKLLGDKRLVFAIVGIALSGVAVAAALRSTFETRPRVISRGVLGPDGVCRAPLGLYCPDKPLALPLRAPADSCPGYSDALRRAKTEPATEAEAGTCGELKWVKWSSWYGGETSYFDSAEELIAVESWSDALGGYCSGKTATIVYGSRPDCDKHATVSLKARPRRGFE